MRLFSVLHRLFTPEIDTAVPVPTDEQLHAYLGALRDHYGFGMPYYWG